MAILLISLLGLFGTFLLGQLARVAIAPSITLNGLDIAVFLFVVGWGSWLIYAKKIAAPSVFKIYSVFVVIAFVSLLLALFRFSPGQVIASSLYLIRFVCYSSIFFIVYSFSNPQKALLKKVMIWTGLLVVVLGFLQLLFYPALRNLLYAGWDEHYYRMFGTFLDPNFLGLFFVLLALFVLFHIGTASPVSKKIWYTIFFFITCIAIVLTYSRTALSTLVIGIITYFVMQKNKRFAIITGALILLGAGVVLLFPHKQTESTNMLRSVSAEARLASMREALTVWSKSPIFGVGFNTYRYASHNTKSEDRSWEESHAAAGSDNSFLFIGATTGIVGFLVFLYFLLQHLRALLTQKSTLLKALGVSSIVAASVGSFFINALFYPSIMLWLWIILAVTESK